jgi:hypothetical protein
MRQLTAEALGDELAGHFLDPELCLEVAAQLRRSPSPDPVGCCEVAFARAAVLEFVVGDTQAPPLAARINTAIDAAVSRMFEGAHTPETSAWYGPGDLRETAAMGVEHYRTAAFWSDRVAKTLADRLGLPRPAPAIAAAFTALTEEAVVWITKVKIR